MAEIFFDALIDSLKMIPWLLVIYIGIELIEYKLGNKIREKVEKSGSTGPLIGSVAGSVPQCGFSVVATALYTQRLATIGTLIAVYLATSDEAIPIILSEPSKANILLPLILTKVVIALVAGYGIDFIFRKKNKKTLEHIHAFAEGEDDKHHNHTQVLNEEACCGHSTSSAASKFKFKELFLHPLIHTSKIFIFILLATLLINLSVFWLGQDSFYGLFTSNITLQPFLAAIVGLIPNCAASVIITELYMKGIITYGSVIAGLCASGGLGILVLLKEEKDKKSVFIILGLLFGISVLAGSIIQYFIKI